VEFGEADVVAGHSGGRAAPCATMMLRRLLRRGKDVPAERSERLLQREDARVSYAFKSGRKNVDQS
jgi:hypothetical protein